MQADKRPDLPDEMRRNYKNVFSALNKIIKEEKFTNLWTGSYATIIRASVLNLAMMVSYDETKERLSKYLNLEKNNKKIVIYSALVSSIFTSLGTLPFDNIKTKIQY